jgi:hypothetical protein
MLSLNTSACHGLSNTLGSDLAVAGSPEPAYPSSFIEPLIPPEDLRRLASIPTPVSSWGLTGFKEKARTKGKTKTKGKAKGSSQSHTRRASAETSKSVTSRKSRTRNRSCSRSRGHHSQHSHTEQDLQPIPPQFTGTTCEFDDPPPPWSDSDSWSIPRYSTIHGSTGSTTPVD